MRLINEICIHCSATREDWLRLNLEAQVKEIGRWHKMRGFDGIGYHWIIGRDGRILNGRSERVQGAHEPKVNRRSIGICLIGGFGSSENDSFLDNYTKEQEDALRNLIAEIKNRYAIKKVSGHNQYAAKACPGFNVNRWLKKKPARRVAQSKTFIGAGTATAAAVGGAVVEVATSQSTVEVARDVVAETQGALYLLSGSEVTQWILTGLTIVGAVLAIYARVRDWQAGRH